MSLSGRRSSQTARGDLPSGKPDEFKVCGEIALPQLARLHQEPPEPFESRCLHPARSPPNEAGQYVKAAAHTHDNGHIEALSVLLAPSLFKGCGHADE